MKINEATFRKILREEARKTLTEDQPGFGEQILGGAGAGLGAGAGTIVGGAAGSLAGGLGAIPGAAAGGVAGGLTGDTLGRSAGRAIDQRFANAHAARTAPSTPLTSQEISELNSYLKNLGATYILPENPDAPAVERVHDEFITKGIFNIDLWTGMGSYPNDYDDAQKQKYKTIFSSLWNAAQPFSQNQLVSIIYNDKGAGGLDNFSTSTTFGMNYRVTGQWDDGNCAMLEKVHNMLLREKMSLSQSAQQTATTAAPTAAAATGVRSYTVVRGDTLSQIAQRFYGSNSPATFGELAKQNKIANPNVISANQKINLPQTLSVNGTTLTLSASGAPQKGASGNLSESFNRVKIMWGL